MKKSMVFAGIAIGLLAGSLGTAQQTSRLETVKSRGKLICGVNNTLVGFGFLETNGSYSGFDTEFCRAVAAAVLGDPSKVDYVPLTAAARFTAVQTGQVDVVFRNTTWTSTRDASEGSGVDFGPVIFYDGSGVMVKADSPAKRITDLDGATICAIQGTTNEQNIADYMKVKRKTYKPLTFADLEKTMAAFVAGRCDAFTSDISQMTAARSTQPNPAAFRIMTETISKEPLTPFVAQNDSRWRDAVSWAVYATMYAEELKITKANLAASRSSTDPAIRRFLGIEGTTGKGLGLSADFAADVIRAVGNYGEIYNKFFGPRTRLNLPRGQNKLYSAGGLLYAPPFR